MLFIKAPTETHRTMFGYSRRDFEGLCGALSAMDLSTTLEHANINLDWLQWKDTFLAAVADYIPSGRLKGRNFVPWINGTILSLIKKKNSVRQKLKRSPTCYLKEKFNLCTGIKRMLREQHDKLFGSLESDINRNPKRFWSILKQKSKSCTIPNCVYMATVNGSAADQDSVRTSAEDPRKIANLLNLHFTSVFFSEDL